MKKTLLVQILSVIFLAFFVIACNKTITEPDQSINTSAKASPKLSKEDHSKDEKKIELPPDAIIIDTVYGEISTDGIVRPNAYEYGTRIITGWAYRDQFKSVNGKALGIMSGGKIPWQTLRNIYGFKMINVGDYNSYRSALTAGFNSDSIVVGISKAQYDGGLDTYLRNFPTSVRYFFIDEPMHERSNHPFWSQYQVIDVARYLEQNRPYATLLLCDYDWDPSDYYGDILYYWGNVKMMCDHYEDQWYYGHARDYETHYVELFGSDMYGNWISTLTNYNTEWSDVADSFGEFMGHQVNLGFNDAWLYSDPACETSVVLTSFCSAAHGAGFLQRLAENFVEHQTCINPYDPVEEQVWLTDYIVWSQPRWQ